MPDKLKLSLPDKHINGLFREYFSKNGLHVRWICKDIDDKIDPGYIIDLSAASKKIIKKQEFKHGEEEVAKKAYDAMVQEADRYDALMPSKKGPIKK